MNNKMILLLSAMLPFILVSGCSSDGNTSSQTVQEFHISYDDSSLFIDPPQIAVAGEEVLLKIEQSSDRVFYLDEEEIVFDNNQYSFVMPDHNVHISFIDSSTSEETTEDKKVLIDYFDRVTGTPMELPYDRIILYESEDEDILEVYRDITTETNTLYRYSVSKDAYKKVLDVIYEKEMDQWHLIDDTYPIDGGYYYLNYWNGEGYNHVTSDAMPDSGFGDFAAVKNSMYGLIEEATLLEKIDLGLIVSQKKNKDGVVTRRQMTEWLEELDINNCLDIISVKQEIMTKNDKEYTHINVYLDEGYFPGEDLSISINEVIRWGSFPLGTSMEDVDEVDFRSRWPLNEGKRYCTAMYTSDKITLKEWSINECSGTVLHYNIPDRFLHEDEKGKYVLLEDINDKCYMDGTEEIIKSDGTSYILDSLWTDNPYFYDYYY